MKKFRYLFEETKIGNKTFDDMELCPGAIKAFKKDYETKDNKEEILSAAQAVDDYLAIERKGLDGNIDETDLEKMKGMVDVAKKKIADAGLSADDHDYHQGHIDTVTSLVKKSKSVEEKTLTPAEIKKRNEIAKAMKKDEPDMPMDKKMAIATATAKRVAEEKSVRQLIDPKKEVMVVKMMSGKRHKVIVIDKSKQKEYLSKGWLLAEEVELNEATDLYNKGGIQIVRFAAGKGKLGVEITVKKGTSASEIGGQIILSDAQFKNLQRALPKIKLKQGLGEAVSPAQQAAIAISKKERGEKPKNEASAAADARRAMKSRGATKGMALTKKDKDTEATDDDRKAASKNIIMQLRKAADLPTGAEVVFNRGKGKVSRDQAKATLARFDGLSKPNEKEKFQKSIRSLADIKKILGR